MGYRDDEEARRQRIETLENQLAKARGEHAEVSAAERDHEERRDQLSAKVTELEEKLAEAKREPVPEPPAAGSPRAPAAARPSLGDRMRVWAGQGLGILVGGGILLTMCGPLLCSFQDCRGGCEPIDRHVKLRWRAEVTEASGVNVPIGTRCTVDSLFFSDRDDALKLWDIEVAVVCDGRTMFERRGRSSCAVEQVRAGSRWSYSVRTCQLHGDETGTIAVWDGPSLVLTSHAPSWRITLRASPTAESAEALYEPELIEGRLPAEVRLGAEVIVVSGSPPVTLGEVCTIIVTPGAGTGSIENCRAAVHCGPRNIRSSPAECTVHDGELLTVEGTGIDVDVGRGTARVTEWEGPGLPFAASLRLADAPPP